jgi:hypothetical protein
MRFIILLTPGLLPDHVRHIFFVFQANVIQQLRIEHDEMLQLDCPRLGVRFRIVDGGLDFKMPKVAAPEALGHMQGVGGRMAGLVKLVRPSGYIAVVDLVATRRTFRCGPDIFVTSRILACLFERAGADVVCVQATPATPSEWADVDDATTAAVATRHAGEADFEDWERDRRTLRALQHAELIRPVLVIAKRRSNPSN